MPILRDREIEQIEQMSGGLTKEETLAIFDLNYTALDYDDKMAFDKAYRKGQCLLLAHSVASLRNQMAGKNGVSASLAVLSRFGDRWEHSEQVAGVRSFRVVLDEGD